MLWSYCILKSLDSQEMDKYEAIIQTEIIDSQQQQQVTKLAWSQQEKEYFQA